ncbi:unnamed protein product [Spirodela intermedia]|uniref:C3H1-type domain-containing protein n=1 Tax=Spirodela intermedia TaxID=51605 RepID=A0A7I8JFJ4_SPIIN|nr:unnamed protein product [Spirodela intermedia]CAA6668909.1 unnamed protein product [Spirodela intermedia]
MPLGKYYCDYCDKQFQDTPLARKRHLEGAQHQRAKALCMRPSALLKSTFLGWRRGFRKGLPPVGFCNNFVRTGFCQFGDGCRYFHPSRNLQNANQVIPGPDAAVSAHSASFVRSQLIRSSNMTGDQVTVSWGILPLSLRPPLESGYPRLPFVDWVETCV